MADEPLKTPVIAVDVMGGDFGPTVGVPGAIDAARRGAFKVILVGREGEVAVELAKIDTSGVDVEIVHAEDVAAMNEKPSDILRRKKNASIQVACRLVKEGRADGVVSPGHSGAAVACGMFIMGRIPGVERPALASIMPTEKRPMVLLDVGANVDCKPHHLLQFGLMANAFAKDILDIAAPRVALLSIGEEEGKGNTLVKETYELFKQVDDLDFVGNVEGRDIFTGEVDVIVCDGFVGNVALKLSEGLASSLSRLLKRELLASFMAKVGTLLAKNAFRRFAKFVDYAEYGGAPLLGLRGIAIVAHGRSNVKAIASATTMAAQFVTRGTYQSMVEAISLNEDLTLFGKAIK